LTDICWTDDEKSHLKRFMCTKSAKFLIIKFPKVIPNYTVIHNYRNSFLCVWSNHSNDMVKLLRCVFPSAFL